MIYSIKWNENDRKQIEKIAYFKWLEAGSPFGGSFWEIAKREYSLTIYLIYEDDYGGTF